MQANNKFSKKNTLELAEENRKFKVIRPARASRKDELSGFAFWQVNLGGIAEKPFVPFMGGRFIFFAQIV